MNCWSSYPEKPASKERQLTPALFLRWCTIAVISSTIAVFVYMEHTHIATVGNAIIEEENSKKLSPYPYDSNEITRLMNCFWPILTGDDLALLDPLELSATIECQPRMSRLFTLHETGILIPQVVNNDFSRVECMYRSLDNSSSPEQPLSTEGPTYLVGTKKVAVKCSRNESLIYSKEFFNFAAQPKLAKIHRKESDDLHLALSIIALDSVSLDEFRRLMPLSARYMKYLGFIDSEMFNKKNFGETIEDIVSSGEKPVWEVMRDRGCISYVSELTNSSIDSSTIDFFSNDSSTNEQCTQEGTLTAVENLEALERFHLHYSRQCTFSLQTVRGFREQQKNKNGSTRWFSKLAALDAKLRWTLERLVANNIAAKTAIVVMGNLGNKHNTDTLAGRVQQSTPLFSIRLPHGFRIKRPDEAAMLFRNRKRFTTNEDIAETLHHIARGFENKVDVVREFEANGLEKARLNPASLFVDLYNEWRRCEWFGIDEAACQCQPRRNGRAKAIGRDSPEHSAVINLIANEVLRLPCIRELSTGDALQVFESKWIPSHSSENITEFEEGLTPRGDIEYFRIEQYVVVREQPFREFWTIKVRAHVRHDTKRDKYKLLGEIVIIQNPVADCTVQRIHDFCQLCTVHGFDGPLRKEESEFEGDQELISAVTHL